MAILGAMSRGCLLATERKNSLSSPSCRIADHEAWISLLLSRGSSVWVIDPPIGSISRRVFGGHQAEKPCQLADIFNLSPIADPGQKVTRHNPADPGNAHHVLNALRQFGIVLTEATDLFGRLDNLLFRKLQTVKQLIELKRTVFEQGIFLSLAFTINDHWLPAGAGGNSIPSKSKSDLMRSFIPTISLTYVSRSCVRWRSSR
jgi:hypothetical protein